MSLAFWIVHVWQSQYLAKTTMKHAFKFHSSTSSTKLTKHANSLPVMIVNNVHTCIHVTSDHYNSNSRSCHWHHIFQNTLNFNVNLFFQIHFFPLSNPFWTAKTCFGVGQHFILIVVGMWSWQEIFFFQGISCNESFWHPAQGNHICQLLGN